MNLSFRPVGIGLFLLASGVAVADREITIPVGRKLTYRNVRFEFQDDLRGKGPKSALLAAGLTAELEIELHSFRQALLGRDRSWQTADFAFVPAGPIADLSPGFSFGVQDIADKTELGVRFYAAITFRTDISLEGGDQPGDLTLGGYFGKHGSGFIGASLPLTPQLRFIVEHANGEIGGGIELRPRGPFAFRYATRGKQTYASLRLTWRF
jgi:hypothetical protein